MNSKHQQSKAREFLWLAIAAMSLATAIHKTIYHSFRTSWYYYIFVLVALFIFFIWRDKRIKGR